MPVVCFLESSGYFSSLPEHTGGPLSIFFSSWGSLPPLYLQEKEESLIPSGLSVSFLCFSRLGLLPGLVLLPSFGLTQIASTLARTLHGLGKCTQCLDTWTSHRYVILHLRFSCLLSLWVSTCLSGLLLSFCWSLWSDEYMRMLIDKQMKFYAYIV